MKIELSTADITTVPADAIVNAMGADDLLEWSASHA
jgi:O-acetyl-ADP-ribose deacetylase (regulator of RNase III)